MSQTGLKTSDLDLDLQGQIHLETKLKLKFCNNLNHGNFTFKLELCIEAVY